MEKALILLVETDHKKQKNQQMEEMLCQIPGVAVKQVDSIKHGQILFSQSEFSLVLLELNDSIPDPLNTFNTFLDCFGKTGVPLFCLLPESVEELAPYQQLSALAVVLLQGPVEQKTLLERVQLYLKLSRLKQKLAYKARELEERELEIEVLEQELIEKNERLEYFSSLDSVTGLFSRRYFEENLQKEWRQAVRQGLPLTILLAEIDSFGDFSASFAGSEVKDLLRVVARALHEALFRPVDIVARYEEEKFIIILPDTAAEGGRQVAGRMLENIRLLRIPVMCDETREIGESGSTLTMSIGVATMVPGSTGYEQQESLLVDVVVLALDGAKKQGGDSFLSLIER